MPLESDSDSTSQSASSISDGTALSSPIPNPKATFKKGTKKHIKKGNIAPWEQCLHFARWIPRAVDMFCILNDMFHIAMLMEEDQAAQVSDKPDDELVKAQRKEVLSLISKDSQEQHMRNFTKILAGAPYLRKLAYRSIKQQSKLLDVLTKMQGIMSQYATPRPTDEGLSPTIFTDNKFCAKLGVNHPQLAVLLCPIKHVKAFHEDPKKVQAQLQNAVIKMQMAAWPTFAYAGDPPSTDLTQTVFKKDFYKVII
ncbi:uncharacterized protein EDB91DRAFT_1245122 [Suillus paluster]|uniref:uncharacterized protein n=1 Tax=Suillus paluster TaxID=48578 RepID=UPI001B85DF32|nr:uncharacterized protein EDB91DRAFT_1245122 [Suillus paluster]KAG1748422.1 hypothetical protein EDB91DRAFT_1245122 [Suillus paluster]